MRRLIHRLTVLLLASAVAVGAVSLPGRAQSAGTPWKVSIGAETADHALEGQDFYPRTITIKAGDTVKWTKNVVLEHTVSFVSGAQPPLPFSAQPDHRVLVNPVVAFRQGGREYDGTGMASSGIIQAAGKTYSLTFTKPGRYAYLCLLHPGMEGTVEVLSAGKAPMTQAELDKAAAAQWLQSLAAGKRLVANWKVSPPESATGSAYTAPMVGDQEARISVMRFTAVALRVKAGSTVRWVMQDGFEIHTVTFQGAGEVPQFLLLAQQAQGPPKIWVNPKVVAPAGGPVHTGNTYYNSGIVFPVDPPGPTAYTVKFSKPGTYTYWCVVHVAEGMRGSIIVE